MLPCLVTLSVTSDYRAAAYVTRALLCPVHSYLATKSNWTRSTLSTVDRVADLAASAELLFLLVFCIAHFQAEY